MNVHHTGPIEADVLVVGAGPGGSAVAHYLAAAGVDVAVLEKAQFPRDKVCGDGLTPAAVKELQLMGVDTSTWTKNRGLTVIGGGHTLHLEWPSQRSLPDFGMARSREQLDHDLISHAVNTGARLYENHQVTGPLTDADGRVVGVKITAAKKGEEARQIEARGRVVIDAGGVSARLATSVGREKKMKRPLAVAARTYFHSPRGDEEWMESYLELWDGPAGESNLLPGYGWIFPLGDGLVNVGLGSVSSTAQATSLPYRKVFDQWMSSLPQEWGFTKDKQIGSLRSAALPMSFNRTPHYQDGLLLVGDAGGMVSPFNGEGIAPAMKAGRFAAETIIDALSHTTNVQADKSLSLYPRMMRAEYGGYYSLGRVFVRLIENPKIMHWCTSKGLGIPWLMTVVHKLLADNYERSGGGIDDRLITALTKVVPKV